MTAPTWSAVDDSTADLLSLVANDPHPSSEFEWRAFVRKACTDGLIEVTDDWSISTDTAGHNAGRPMRVYRWIGSAA